MTSVLEKKSPNSPSHIANSFVMTGKFNKIAFKNLIGDHKNYCDSLKKSMNSKFDDSYKVIDLADDDQNNKSYVIVGTVLSKFIDNDALNKQNFKFEISQLTQSNSEAEIISEQTLRRIFSESASCSEYDIDVLQSIQCGQIIQRSNYQKYKGQISNENPDTLNDWGLRLNKQWFVANDQIWELDPMWANIRREVRQAASKCQVLASHLNAVVLSHRSLEKSLAYILCTKLESTSVQTLSWFNLFCDVLQTNEKLQESIRCDLKTIMERDPACEKYSHALLHFKGFQSVCLYRISNVLYHNGRQDLALSIMSQASQQLGCSIHPGAKIGKGVMFDHAQGIVVGETTVIGDNCSIFHNVYLGGKGEGDRHPKIGNNVVIGAQSIICGNLKVGENSKIAANSVILEDVPPNVTMAGNPARIMGGKKKISQQQKPEAKL